MRTIKYDITNNITALLIVACAFLLGSCEQVIDLDLNNAEKKYVIEAVITDQPNTARVLITQTKDFDENNDFPGVSGATVSITELGGATYPMVESSQGVYESAALTASSGKTYQLLVSIGGQTFEGESSMPQKVSFDSLYVTDEFLFTDTRKIANAIYTDPAGRGNNYRFIQYVNGKKEEQILVMNDDYTDGRPIVGKLFYFSDEDDDSSVINSGDTLTVEMLCIDAEVYRYWFSLARSATGSSGQATPSNPVSNIRGDALGYFSAHSFESKTITVP
jgi:hypothetical protein